MERHYYRFLDEKLKDTKVFKTCERDRISTTSFDKRERIDAFSRKIPLMETFSLNTMPKQTKTKNSKTTSINSTFKKKVIKAFEKVKKGPNKENNRLFYIPSELNDESDPVNDESDSESEASTEEEKPKATSPSNQSNDSSQFKNENKPLDDFLFKKYEFQLKLACNLNQIQALETKYLGYSPISNTPIKQVSLSLTKVNNSPLTDNPESDKNATNKFFTKNTLFTANSKPLLAKRVQSAVERK